jgi:hypothetical protein
MKINQSVWLLIITLGLLISFTRPFYLIAQALVFTDNSEITFDQGTYSNTDWLSLNNGVGITSAGAGCTNPAVTNTCTYTSAIKDTGVVANFSNLSWLSPAPYMKEMPNNQVQETGYISGNMNMSGNIALWHFNEVGNNPSFFADSSGNGNNAGCGNAGNCPVGNTSLPWRSARNTNNSTRFITTSNGNSVKGLSAFSISFWTTTMGTSTADRVLYEEAVPIGVSPTIRERVSIRLLSSNNITPNLLVFQGRTASNEASPLPTLWVSRSIPTPTVGVIGYHIVAIFDSINDVHKLVVNGVETSNTVAESAFGTSNPVNLPRFARSINNNAGYSTNIDEAAIFNRALSSAEALNLHRRGISANIRFQIRSCDDPSCSGESFVGPDGTSTTFFQESISGNTPSFNLNSTFVPNNRYIQYRATFAAGNFTALNPILNSTTITYSVFNINPSISMVIRRSDDLANTNNCDLGIASQTNVATCSYRLKIRSNAPNGYVVNVLTSGSLTGVNQNIVDANIGSGGTGGHDISLSTTGTERYGIIVNTGSITGSGGITRAGDFNAGTNAVRLNNTSFSTIATSTGTNSPSNPDTTNTILITHRLNISANTKPGDYTQTVTYNVTPMF